MYDLIKFIHEQHDNRLGNNILLPWGCDFTYMNALAEYKNIERMMEYVNSKNNYNITIKMSTPSDYIEALKKEKIKWPVKYEDGFPYGSNDYEVWAGYYSSRPVAKKMTKDASAILNAENFIFSQRMLQENTKDSEIKDILNQRTNMLQALSTYLHHDAITGTAKQQVANDYMFRMNKAIEKSRKVYSKMIKKVVYDQTKINFT